MSTFLKKSLFPHKMECFSVSKDGGRKVVFRSKSVVESVLTFKSILMLYPLLKFESRKENNWSIENDINEKKESEYMLGVEYIR